MDADDFQDLYKLLRGSRSAAPVLDARALFLDKKMVQAHEKLIYARAQFAESRTRLLKQDPEKQVDPKAKDAERQIKKLKRKKEKIEETLESFDELIPPLEKLARRETEKLAREAANKQQSEPTDEAEPTQAPAPKPPPAAACPADVSNELIDAITDSRGDDRLDVIDRWFGFQEVASEADIHGNSLYYIHTSDSSLLVTTPSLEEMAETVTLVNVVDDKPIKPFTRKEFLGLGQRRKMVLLTKKESGERSNRDGGPERDNATQDAGDETTVQENDADQQKVLDMGAFSQLLTAAQRSGLVPGADQIGHVRDREFRMEKYDHAFQAINAIYSQFTASSNQRTQKLSREDADIASGKIKISPKDLLAKRARDRVQTQEIERANRRFQVVLEGLRILMHAS